MAGQVISSDGCWSSWAEPIAVHRDQRSFIGYINSSGDVKICMIDHISGERKEQTLAENFANDDHGNPTILIRNSDERLITFWDRSGDIHYRISKQPLCVSKFHRTQTLEATSGNYASPVQVPNEDGRIYLFYRDGIDQYDKWRHHCYRYSDDGGMSWSSPQVFVDFGTNAKARRRAYAKIAKSNDGSIHIGLSSHPHHCEPHNIHYLKFKDRQIYDVNNNNIADHSEFPVTENDIETVWQDPKGNRKSWIYDIADFEGDPRVVFASYPYEVNPVSGRYRKIGPLIHKLHSHIPQLPIRRDTLLRNTLKLINSCVRSDLFSRDHQYHYAYFNSSTSEWVNNCIIQAGGSIATDVSREPCYSGGITFNRSNANEIYLSVASNQRQFKILKGITNDDGNSWEIKEYTQPSGVKNGRPVGVKNFNNELEMIYWSGDYYHFTSYDTKVIGNALMHMGDI